MEDISFIVIVGNCNTGSVRLPFPGYIHLQWSHDDAMIWKRFTHGWHFVMGIHH